MGCDIHLYAERLENGAWGYLPGCPDPGRNYALYSILADVRNYHDLPVIAEPKGLPDDISEELKNETAQEYDPEDEEWSDVWLGDHSFSWFTLRELLDFDWCQPCTRSGLISVYDLFMWEDYNRKLGESPKSWAVWAAGYKGVTEDEAHAIIERTEGTWREKRDVLKRDYERTMCQVDWTQPLYKTCRCFWDTLMWLICQGDSEEVRIVFGFDN